MEVVNLNIGNNPAAFAQPEAPPAVNMPPQGINLLLDVVGFHNPVQHEHLIETGLSDYEDFCYLVEKDIRDMAEEFSKRTVAQGHITFGLGRIKHLTGLMHWIQDCFHASDDPGSITFDKQL